MKVTQVSICPSKGATEAGRPAVPPELLASIGAKYSRSNDGLDAIMAKVDLDNPEASIERIFKHTDYGHQSIADMVPVAMFMDGISMYLAYFVWYTCQATNGQESSTRYLPMVPLGLTPESEDWHSTVLDAIMGSYYFDNESFGEDVFRHASESFACYNLARKFWFKFAESKDGIVNLINLTDEQAADKKVVERLTRNYAFDRARVYLPVTALTNMMLVMSSREWARLASHLLSHPLCEFNDLGELIVDELRLVSPNFVRHAKPKRSHSEYFSSMLEQASWSAVPADGEVGIDILSDFTEGNEFATRNNRYCSPLVGALDSTVRMRFNSISMAEMRDVNRHRQGMRSCIMDAHGFYCPISEDPEASEFLRNNMDEYSELCMFDAGVGITQSLLDSLDAHYMYFTNFGTTHQYRRVCSLAQFVYEVELRTGPGAHYKYAQLYRDMYAKASEQLDPAVLQGVVVGGAEPE